MIDSAALRAADIVVVDTDEHLAALPPRHRSRAVVIPVGAPAAWYEAAAGPVPSPPQASGGLPGQSPSSADPPGQSASSADPPGPLRVVFYGLYTPLQGTPSSARALSQIAGAPIEVTMVGGGQDAPAGAGRRRGQPGGPLAGLGARGRPARAGCRS